MSPWEDRLAKTCEREGVGSRLLWVKVCALENMNGCGGAGVNVGRYRCRLQVQVGRHATGVTQNTQKTVSGNEHTTDARGAAEASE